MKYFRIAAGALLVGAATLAGAQTRAQSFADQFKSMQSLQSVGTYTFKPAPALSSEPNDPVVRQSFADNFAQMQALSSNSGEWSPQSASGGGPAYASAPADPVGRESFSSMFARMQAASSNSGEWKAPAGADTSAYAATQDTTAANEPGRPTLAQRIARALNFRGTGSSQTN